MCFARSPFIGAILLFLLRLILKARSQRGGRETRRLVIIIIAAAADASSPRNLPSLHQRCADPRSPQEWSKYGAQEAHVSMLPVASAHIRDNRLDRFMACSRALVSDCQRISSTCSCAGRGKVLARLVRRAPEVGGRNWSSSPADSQKVSRGRARSRCVIGGGPDRARASRPERYLRGWGGNCIIKVAVAGPTCRF
jgi:hypothetical protein